MEILRVVNLVKNFKEKKALNNVSFDLNYGEILGYLGHNGAGKTTTIRILLGLLEKDNGEVYYNGSLLNFNSKDFDNIRKEFGVMLDYPGLYKEITAYDNLKLFASLYEIPTNEFDERVKYFAKKLEIENALRTKVKNFSRGMMQKISFIRAIQHLPKIVFLDEPMITLDPVARTGVRDIIIELKEKYKTSFFITSHDLEEMDKLCDKIVILEKGNIVLSGRLEDIKSSGLNYLIELDKEITNGVLNSFIKSFNLSDVSFNKTKISFFSKTDITLTDIFEFFGKNGVKVVNIEKKEKSLESIYLQIVNKNESK